MTHKAAINLVKQLFSKKGQGMVEYVLIIGFIALIVIASLTPIGTTLAIRFAEFAAAINSK